MITRGRLVDRGGSITTGGTAQQVAAANEGRNYLFIQNTSTGDLWVGFNQTASVGNGCIRLTAGANYETPPNFTPIDLVHIFGATTGQTFTCKEG